MIRQASKQHLTCDQMRASEPFVPLGSGEQQNESQLLTLTLEVVRPATPGSAAPGGLSATWPEHRGGETRWANHSQPTGQGQGPRGPNQSCNVDIRPAGAMFAALEKARVGPGAMVSSCKFHAHLSSSDPVLENLETKRRLWALGLKTHRPYHLRFHLAICTG